MVGKKITVLQILPDLETGGVEQGTLELGNFLVAYGHTSLVISRGGRMVEDLVSGGSQHIFMPFIGEKSPRPLGHIPALRRLLQKVDVVHLRSRVPAWAGWLAWKSLPEKKRPLLITTFHGVYSVNSYSAIMTKGERVIAVSDAILQHILANYSMDPERLIRIPRGADSRRFDPGLVSAEKREAIRKEWGCGQDSPLILVPGRFSRIKGQDFVLQAMEGLRELPWQLVFVGDPAENPAYAEELGRMASGFGKRIVLAGYRKDMPEVMAASDLVLSPSRQPESFGRVLAEAGMMEKPVLASAHGGSLEIVEDGRTGLLFSPEDEDDFRKKLQILLQNDAVRESMGKEAGRRIRAHFTIEAMCCKTLELYLTVLEEKKGPGWQQGGENRRIPQ
ncbi:glycosyltransferase family 4 protein [Desulfobotulus sp. H1]|uniref:Glycosyltransferase family 4 protein n=1 Tax=Desulfobotulus pelophilus TaxID=2823377 RepID=A0ABT3NA92_9BACT|nr:glycosyltransferase family 4 protein [Desulfobotulus pelophilus]MCW7754096.1 glycosyltransferase family 4 protein [Desulfobotulus pelophilus]